MSIARFFLLVNKHSSIPVGVFEIKRLLNAVKKFIIRTPVNTSHLRTVDYSSNQHLEQQNKCYYVLLLLVSAFMISTTTRNAWFHASILANDPLIKAAFKENGGGEFKGSQNTELAINQWIFYQITAGPHKRTG